ncbi:MAG: SDR family oxidoreductase [Alphaproteobacteria bacterium]|nr:MAG: SDR family oxidoreductase [Alphaproteobacteria bacterium]
MNGKVALVTGGAQGIGLAIARQLAAKGAHSVIADINLEKAVAAAEALRQDDLAASAVKMDVASEDAVNHAMSEIETAVGAPLIIVNNAGIAAESPALDMPMSTWHRNIAIMLTGPLLVARAAAPAMIKARWGRIINMGSLMSFTAFGKDAGYCAAKAGILGLSRSLAADLAPFGVCVNTICPGNILTELMEETARAIEARDGLAPGSFLAERPKAIPLGRLGTPEDIADLAAFLASDAASYITGQAIHVNGGLYYH